MARAKMRSVIKIVMAIGTRMLGLRSGAPDVQHACFSMDISSQKNIVSLKCKTFHEKVQLVILKQTCYKNG